MKTKIKFLVSNYGQNITIIKESNTPSIHCNAFIQPLRCDEQSELYGDYVQTEGVEQFLYIGLPEIELSSAPITTTIILDGQNYIIKKAEKVYLSSKAIYERAVLEKSID